MAAESKSDGLEGNKEFMDLYSRQIGAYGIEAMAKVRRFSHHLVFPDSWLGSPIVLRLCARAAWLEPTSHCSWSR